MVGIAIYRHFQDNLRILPEEIAWPYTYYKSHPFGWEYHGGKANGYYSKDFVPGEEYFEKMMNLIRMGEPKNLVKITKITAVCMSPLHTLGAALTIYIPMLQHPPLPHCFSPPTRPEAPKITCQ